MTKKEFPNSKKTYKSSSLHGLQVPFRTIDLDDPNTEKFTVYDTSGHHGDALQTVDYKKGMGHIRKEWIQERDVRQLDKRSIPYETPYKLEKDGLIFNNKPALLKKQTCNSIILRKKRHHY